jgi:hypothetical protein
MICFRRYAQTARPEAENIRRSDFLLNNGKGRTAIVGKAQERE